MPLSPHSLQTLRGYVVEQRAVLHGGVVREYDVALSAMLSVLQVEPLPSLPSSMVTKSVKKADLCCSGCECVQVDQRSVKLDDEVMERGIAVCKVGEIVEKGLEEVGLRMEDVVLSPAAIALAVPEEREEDETKGDYPTAHREYSKRIKEKQWKLEDAMEPPVAETNCIHKNHRKNYQLLPLIGPNHVRLSHLLASIQQRTDTIEHARLLELVEM
ncbi:uncharacterized protein MONOS_14840 [Monocercomonoides exilis]|uniref:uncharacterized protein n=1 Tax=Monocercomonoides exilis TaxID=2049356 RepID=UPI00355AAD38|nr:hypothetical protein MONOS_14840 [Monocercomonoides exilis]|eukprot:MONOS_14840.1-p1 / transcript=MONOS_14840.1 / gene=MONOS_14840 / organism=Monocercomonoides_exilis_PA203 / gene_product=unspecified product / transcript_product=unspecified product / location=Mono_scaffold01083:13515-14523(+) / protein_length=215 / sequence_SO=supercontig / SO=protein_coding / is_pseudo=false